MSTRSAILAFFVIGWVAHAALAETPESIFARANSAYEVGEYEAAIEGYHELVASGAADRDLYYNLGNAFFKTGQLGYAVLYYERARKLAPRDEDIRNNLSLTRSLLADRQFVVSPGFIRRVLMWPHNEISTRESFVVASVVYALLLIAVIGFVLRATSPVDSLYKRLSLLSPGRLFGLDRAQDMVFGICVLALVFLLSGGSALSKFEQEKSRAVGVMIVDETAVYSGPSSDATLQFRVHEGTKVKVDGGRAGWLEIKLPGELSGWVPANALERI